MAKAKCDICGADINSMIKDTYFINNEPVCFCKTCWKNFMDSRSDNPLTKLSALSYFRKVSAQKAMTPAGQACIDTIIRPEEPEPIDPSVPEATGEPVPDTDRIHDRAPADYSMRFTVAGVIFAVLAVILFLVSIIKITFGNETIQVANIQATVFSATCFVSAVVCFAAAGIIKHINQNKR